MSAKAFDASKYMTDLNGKDYLEVKWRLLWLRTEHPDAVIETELVKFGSGLALFRARVAVPGSGTATGWGSETADDFGDYIEKAETKALGRALAALGFGTQFCEDYDFSAQRERAGASRRAAPRSHARPRDDRPVVDSPVRRNPSASSGQAPSASSGQAPSASSGQGLRVVRDREAEGATVSQVKAIYAIARDEGAEEPAVDERCRSLFGAVPAQLSKRQASRFIELLRRPASTAAAAAAQHAGP